MLYKSPNRKETTVPYQVTVRKDTYIAITRGLIDFGIYNYF